MAMSSPQSEVLIVGPLEVYVDEEFARVDGRAVVVSGHAFGLLVAFARRPRQVLARETLYQDVWGGPLRPGDRSVDVILTKLRAALGQAAPHWRLIQTHQHRGYRLAPTLHAPFATSAERDTPALPAPGARLVVEPVEIIPPDLLVIVDGRETIVRARDMEVLVLLATNAGRVLSREAILRAVWNRPFSPSDRIVDVAVGHLRSSLATIAPDWDCFHTHFRRGYRFEPVRKTEHQSVATLPITALARDYWPYR
jgi:DNA-binding response OmpR family regulator